MDNFKYDTLLGFISIRARPYLVIRVLNHNIFEFTDIDDIDDRHCHFNIYGVWCHSIWWECDISERPVLISYECN